MPQRVVDLGAEASIAKDRASADQLLIEPRGTEHTGLPLDRQVRSQFHGRVPQAPGIVLAAALGQVVRHLPEPFGDALDDARTAQRFQAAHVSGNDLLWLTASRGVGADDGEVMLGAVEAVARQGGDGAVSRARTRGSLHLDDRSWRVVRQIVACAQHHVVCLPIGAIDDEVASVAQLVGQTLAGHPADDRRAALPLLRRRKNGQFTPLPLKPNEGTLSPTG